MKSILKGDENMKTINKIICLMLCVVMIFTANSIGVQAAPVNVAATSKLTATATADTVKLSWNKVNKATGYRVYRIVDGKLKTIKKSVKTNKYTVEKLTAGETYKFAVKTYRTQNGKTYWSSKYKTVTVKTKAMSAPKKPTATSTKDTVTLKWAKVPGATGYDVYQLKGEKWTKIKTLTANTYKVSSLKENKTFKFKIRPYAKTAKGKVWGKYSSVVAIQTVDKTKVKFTEPVIGTKGVTLKWGAISGASGYRVNMLKNGEWVKVAGVKGAKNTSYKVDRLKSNTKYTFMVRAYKMVDGKVKWFTKSDSLTVKTNKAQDTTTTTTTPSTQKPDESTTTPTTVPTTNPTTTESTTKPTTTKPTTTESTTKPTTTESTTTKPTTTKPTTTKPTTTKPTTTLPTTTEPTTKPTTTKPTTTKPTTTKPTTTEPTTKPTTTKPTTTKPTTTKPTTTQPTTQPTTYPEPLSAYRIAMYKEILDKETIYFKVSSKYNEDEMVPVEFARKNGNMCMATSAEGIDMKIFYDKSSNKMQAYAFLFLTWVYYNVPKEEMADMDMTEMLDEIKIKNVGEISVTRTKFDGKSVFKESYYDAKTGYTMNYYFDGDVLVGIKKEHPTKVDEIIYVEEISNTVPKNIFTKPGGISLDAFNKMFG